MDCDEKMTDDYQSAVECPKIHGVFKAILGLVAVSMVANIVFLFLSSEKIDLLYSHSPFYALTLIFFGVIFPTVIAAMAFNSLRDRRGDTPILLQTYMLYMMLGALALYRSDILNWKLLAYIAVWLPCFFYMAFSKQVKRIFPLEKRNITPRFLLSLVGLILVYVLFVMRLGSIMPYDYYDENMLLIDEKTLQENEYSDGLIRLIKPSGLQYGTMVVDEEEIITLFNEDCQYFIKSGVGADEVREFNDTWLEGLVDGEYSKHPYELMSDSGIGVEGDKRISAHRKSYLYYTEPYRTMVDVVLLRDYRTPKYCIIYGVYEEGTGSHTMEIVDAVRFR